MDKGIIEHYEKNKDTYEHFLNAVEGYFKKNEQLNSGVPPVIHSMKTRLKESSHLEKKLKRKRDQGCDVNKENLFQEITDFAGIRVMHLYQDQIRHIHTAIIGNKEWVLLEKPKAYTWDRESETYYADLGIEVKLKPTFYTSVHYLVKPNNSTSNVCCEIQVRTLFEEIWGEIDHAINYPTPTGSIGCKEQLRVLSKLVGTGTRLADSIFRTHNDHLKTLNSKNSTIFGKLRKLFLMR